MTDHEALRAMIQRYARAVDARDVESITALFLPDATITGARGEQTLDEWLEIMRVPPTFPTSMHHMGDPLIDLDEGSHVASLDTYAVVYQFGGEGQSDLTLGVRYLDVVVRHDGRWVIKTRTATTLWMR